MEKVKKMLSLAFASLFRRNKGQNTVKEKRQRSHQINMLEGPLGKKIHLFTTTQTTTFLIPTGDRKKKAVKNGFKLMVIKFIVKGKKLFKN